MRARILCNLPLECFDDRARFAAEGIEFASYGPPERMLVDGTHFPFDVAFDPSTGTIEELLAAVPPGFVPDLVLVFWPDQEPLPRGAERCPVPLVGVVSDYNLSLPLTAGLWPFFDVLLCDRGGVDLHRELGFADVRPWVQFSFKARFHRAFEGVPRDLDVGFAGNANPLIHGPRTRLVERLLGLRARGVSVEARDDVCGEAYGRLLSRARIGFNRSVRGELNLRAFEVPACGALLLVEDSNLEVRELFRPGEEVVLYAEDELEDVVLELLADEPRRARIARAGHERVADYRMSKRLRSLVEMLGTPALHRPVATPAEVARGRARALAWTWAAPAERLHALLDAQALAPEDPAIVNDLGVEVLRAGSAHLGRAVELFERALAIDSSHVPAARNLVWLAERTGDAEAVARGIDVLESRLACASSFAHFDGLTLPLAIDATSLAVSREFARALRCGDARAMCSAFGAGGVAAAVR